MVNSRKRIASSQGALVFILFALCCVSPGCIGPSEKFIKIMHMPLMPLSPGSSFETVTHNGSIDLLGSDVTDCNVIATITGYASTVEAAEDLVERTKLNFEQTENRLVLKINRPQNLINRSVSVSLDIILPEETNLDLQSHNGGIDIKSITGTTNAMSHNGGIYMENITGKTRATSHNGRVFVKNISGPTKLETHNGAVDAENISGDIDFLSHNGRVKAVFSENAEPDSNITMVTHNGGIDLTPPPDYSARVDISTHNGSLNIGLPVTISGDVSKGHLVGTVRDGKGRKKLETHNGSIDIR
ncbi:MAG: DUF4097 family beta strand repeat-containing protein [Sedimentisphaerales bacterium]